MDSAGSGLDFRAPELLLAHARWPMERGSASIVGENCTRGWRTFQETVAIAAMKLPTPQKQDGKMSCTLAESAGEREQVYRLRYACYRRKQAIDPLPGESFSDGYDRLPNHFSFLMRSGGAALATVRISVVRPDLAWVEAPCQKVFGDCAAFQGIAGRSFVEASRLCFGEQARRDALMQLVAYLAALADFYEVDWMVACPREEHSAIYQRLFGFLRLAEPRQYFGVKFRTSLLAVSREQLGQYTGGTKAMDSARANALARLSNAAGGRCGDFSAISTAAG